MNKSIKFTPIMSEDASARLDAQISHLSGPNEATPTSETKDQGITHFKDDTTGVLATPIASGSNDSTFGIQEIEGAGDIKAFLARPTILTQGTFTTTDSGILYSVDPFYALVTGAKAKKLDGIYGIRADVRISLHVNAVRFQTGRYLLGFVPSGGVGASHVGYVAKFKMHSGHIIQRSQLPHVEIDIATQTHVEFLLPWDTVYPYFVNLSTYPVGIGKILLAPYVALSAASGDSTAGYTIFASFENISLTGPTFTQSAYSTREQKTAGIGPVESAMTRIQTVSSIIGTIPQLSGPANAVGWTAGIMAKVASAFGWSKPLHLGTATPVYARPYRYLAVSDGEALSEPLGAVSTNAVSSCPRTGGTVVDEMSIDFIKSIYSLYTVVTWDSNDAAGAILAQPFVGIATGTSMGNGISMTPLEFLGSQFTEWRGGIKFRFKLVKNEFYSGRLSVRYEPNWHNTTGSSTLAQSEYSHRVIVDIRECSEFEVICPYVSNELYTRTTTGIGNLSIQVLDPLVAPSSVPAAISIIIEVAGDSDLEFVLPNVSEYEPWVPAVTQSGYSSYPVYRLGAPVQTNTTQAAQLGPGEKVESLRQLCKLFNPTVFSNNAFKWVTGANHYATFRPFQHEVVTQATSNVTALVRGNIFADWIDVISNLYAMETGGMRAIVHDIDAHNNMIAGIYYHTGAGVADHALSSYRHMRTFRTLVNGAIGTPGDFTLPSYQQTMGRPVASNIYSGGTPSLAPPDTLETALNVALTSWAAFDVTYGKLAADDWNAYGFISIPLLISNNVT